MAAVDQTADPAVAGRGAASTSSSAEVRRALRQVRSLAAAGRWRKLVMTLDAAGAASDHYELVLQRLYAAVELGDDAQIAICVEAARRISSVERRINLASLFINSNRPVESESVLASLPIGDPSPKAVKVARRIIAATKDRKARGRLGRFLGNKYRDIGGPQPIAHRYPGDLDVFEAPPSKLAIVRLPGVAPAIERRVKHLWKEFAARLETKPFPLVREYENVFVNEEGQIWSVDGTPVKAYGRPLPAKTDPTSAPILDEAFSCVRENKGYFEFVVDRLATLSWRLAPGAPDCPILLRKEQRGLAIDALGSLGVSEDKIIALSGTVFCRRLYLGSSSLAALARTGAYLHSFGRLIELADARDRGDTPKRFYISRRDSPRRAMTNEADFETGIAALGYTPIVLSQLGMLEKITLFRNADVVIGAHGAGWSPLLFAKPGLRVVEIMPVTMNQFSHMSARVCFSMLSTVRGLDHLMVLHPMNSMTSEWKADPALIASLV